MEHHFDIGTQSTPLAFFLRFGIGQAAKKSSSSQTMSNHKKAVNKHTHRHTHIHTQVRSGSRIYLWGGPKIFFRKPVQSTAERNELV